MKKAEETNSSSEMSSEDEFLAQSAAHMRIKTVKKATGLNEASPMEIGMLQEQVTELEKQLESAKQMI